MRFDDSPDLFGRGSGYGTSAPIICEWCGVSHNEGNLDKEGNVVDLDRSVRFTEFGGKQIAECCFEKIERAVYGRRSNVLSWFRKLQDAERKELDETETLLVAAEPSTAQQDQPHDA